MLKKDTCLVQVFRNHSLYTEPSLGLTCVLETGPLLARFTNRTVLEMIAFAQKTVAAYESMCLQEARGPCHENLEGKWWSRCPEDLMSVMGMYVGGGGSQDNCRPHTHPTSIGTCRQ